MLQKDDEINCEEKRLSQKTLLELEGLLGEKGDIFEKNGMFGRILDSFDEEIKKKILALHNHSIKQKEGFSINQDGMGMTPIVKHNIFEDFNNPRLCRTGF